MRVSGGGRSHFTELKTDSGAPGLESLPAEVNKPERVRRLELPADLFADVSEKLVDACRRGRRGSTWRTWTSRLQKRAAGAFRSRQAPRAPG